MIHTAEFYVELEEAEVISIRQKYKKKLYKRMTDTELGLRSTDGIRCVFNRAYCMNKGFVWRAHIYVNFQVLLNKPQIIPEDSEEIDFKIAEYISDFTSASVIMSRLDFKIDAVIIDSNIRKILLKLYKKCINKRYFMIKSTKHENSVRFNSKSRSNNIYDKECERIDKGQKIQGYEKNVLRFEAQIRRNHISYKYKKNKVDRSIKKYLNNEFHKKYMNEMVIKIIGKGEYYNLYRARNIISKSTISPKYKEEIISFMKKASKAGITEAKKQVSDYKYKKYLELLEKLDINPILIPKQYGISHISNPLKDFYSQDL